ncbi:MAG: DUF362 domain-containing protein [Bryobacteraceae bacterium]
MRTTRAMTRRELLAMAGSAALLRGNTAPAPPVSIAKCASYKEDITAILSTMFDQLGGAGGIVRNKTVTIKLNLTGSPALRFQGRPLGVTHYTHPKTVAAMLHVLDRAGARRIRLVESCWGTAGPLEEYMLDSGWNVRGLESITSKVEFENTNAVGKAKKYSRLKVPGGGLIFPAYELNHSYEETDVFMSMAKLKNHDTCGVTLAMKNCFGITPASVYGDDAGVDEPNESPGTGRVDTCHFGKRQPSRAALPELDPSSSREPGYRMPRITAELAAARPIDIAFVEGIETIAGGEGPWIKGIRPVRPGVLILGTNGVATDTVATAVMGYDPAAGRGAAPFQNCDNTLKLAESLGAGSADLKRIEVRGIPIDQARFPFAGA